MFNKMRKFSFLMVTVLIFSMVVVACGKADKDADNVDIESGAGLQIMDEANTDSEDVIDFEELMEEDETSDDKEVKEESSKKTTESKKESNKKTTNNVIVDFFKDLFDKDNNTSSKNETDEVDSNVKDSEKDEEKDEDKKDDVESSDKEEDKEDDKKEENVDKDTPEFGEFF